MTAAAEWREYGPSALPKVLQAALDAFAEHGYYGTGVRDIAAGAGLSVAGVYHHHRSKQEILVQLLEHIMGDLLERSRAAVAEAGPDPSAQFDALVESMLRFHMFRQREAFVASTERRSLEPANRERYIALRDEQQTMLTKIIKAARRRGDFATKHPDDVSRTISTLCVGVAAWYRPEGRLQPTQLVQRHLAMARLLVEARPA